MKVYELIPEGDALIFRVSVVKDPAVEATLMKFNKETMCFLNEEKRVIYSVAMRPDKLIFRSNVSDTMTPEPAYVYYTKETIEACQQNYFKHNRNAETNVNHEEDNTEGVYCFESWIVKDKENDKSKALGLEVVNGDWVMGFKVENEDVWQEVKKGNLDGLSIETYMPKKESNIKLNNKMSKLEKVTAFFKELFADEEEGKTPEEIAAAEAKKKAEEDMAAQAEADKQAANDGEPKPPEGDNVEELKATIETLTKENEELKAKIAAIEADKVKAETDLETMKKQTAKAIAVPKTPVVMKKDYKDMSNFEKLKFNRENKI
jgi:RNA binding exosome subunit